MEVIDIVRDMIIAGSARAIMGNHDFNVVAFNTPLLNQTTGYLRSRTAKNTKQCGATQHEIDAHPERGSAAIEFLAGLPLWLDLGHARFVHAFWDPPAMAALGPFLHDNNALTAEGFIKAAAPDGRIGNARSILLSGPEIACEPREDRYGHLRSMMRREWWLEAEDASRPPVFFGHYALSAPQRPFGAAVCLDAGVARGGPLVAYRHTARAPLDAREYVYV